MGSISIFLSFVDQHILPKSVDRNKSILHEGFRHLHFLIKDNIYIVNRLVVVVYQNDMLYIFFTKEINFLSDKISQLVKLKKIVKFSLSWGLR